MGEIIQKELPFETSDEQKEWELERKQWRLPYWDWALPANEGSVPALFQMEQISIRTPAAAKQKSSGVSSKTVPNPLYRYQLKVDDILTTMGDLPYPFTVDDVLNDERTAVEFPVSKVM